MMQGHVGVHGLKLVIILLDVMLEDETVVVFSKWCKVMFVSGKMDPRSLRNTGDEVMQQTETEGSNMTWIRYHPPRSLIL
jgi:hypothetical protein